MSGFNDQQYADVYPDGIEHHYWNIARKSLIRRVLSSSSAEAPVLDIGCGRGVVVADLRRHGIEARGCDIAQSQPLDDEVAPFLDHGVEAAALDPELRASVRTILLLDVVEHLEKPQALLDQCVSQFPSATRLLLTVPARMEIWSEWDEMNEHQRRYDRESLRQLLTNSGFEVLSVGYFFHALYAAARSMSVLGMSRATAMVPPSGSFSARLHRVVASGLSLEARLLPSGWAGSSLIGVARPRPTI